MLLLARQAGRQLAYFLKGVCFFLLNKYLKFFGKVSFISYFLISYFLFVFLEYMTFLFLTIFKK